MAIVVCGKCGAKNRIDPARAANEKPVCGKCGAVLSVAAVSDGRPVIVTDAGFQTVVMSERRPVLVDCWAAWCGPCRMIAPVMDELAAEANGRYVIAKLNVDENPGVSQRYQISSIPTMLLFHNGELVDRIVGLQPKQALAARLAKLGV